MQSKATYGEKYIEKHLSIIGSKVSQANEMSTEAKNLCEKSNILLRSAQKEIADLYESLDEMLFVSHIESPKD